VVQQCYEMAGNTVGLSEGDKAVQSHRNQLTPYRRWATLL